jgi:hypothetical protein
MMKKLAFAILLPLLGLPAAAGAQQAPAAGGFQHPCASDAQTLCPGMKGMDVRKCLMNNMSKVSQECGTALANARSEMREYSQACGADIRQYCGNEAAGPARHQCVIANQSKFSQACQNALAAVQSPH